MADRASQRAGDNSQQTIIENYYAAGITEERAVEIADARARLAIAQYSAEAEPIVRERIRHFDNRLIKNISRDDLLDSFVDPAFLAQVQRVQISAASTERELDYDLLSRLVTQRAKGKDRYIAAAVHRSVEIVNLVDEAALIGLTVMWMTLHTSPVSSEVIPGLSALNGIYEQFPLDDLPAGRMWLDHLDTLDVLRISQLSAVPSYSAYLTGKLPCYLSRGFNADQNSAMNDQLADIITGVTFSSAGRPRRR